MFWNLISNLSIYQNQTRFDIDKGGISDVISMEKPHAKYLLAWEKVTLKIGGAREKKSPIFYGLLISLFDSKSNLVWLSPNK